MLTYLKGRISAKKENFVVVETANIGYKVFCSANTLNKLIEGEEVKIFTYLYLREGVMELYGFLTEKEIEFFEFLLEIPGIGPKASLIITSIGSEEELRKAIEAGDEKFFKGVKGIGTKKIQKIILEMTGKFEKIKQARPASFQRDEALDALVSLGFSSQRSKSALSQVAEEIKDPQERIKEALKILGR